MILMLGSMADAASIAAGFSVALLAPLYGLLISQWMFSPLGAALEPDQGQREVPGR